MAKGTASFLVLSDSHGHVPALKAVLKWAHEEPAFDAALFLGDGNDDLPVASRETGFTLPWYKVRGNGDYNFSIADSLIVEVPLDSKKIKKLFCAHGHRYGVERGALDIAEAAKKSGADAALFGHTHTPYCGFHNGIFALNPGSIGRPREGLKNSFAVLTCPAEGPFNARFYCLEKNGSTLLVREKEQK